MDRPADARARARPFLKWAGGKQALAAELVRRFPATFERYFEPFVGGGSVFFELGPGAAVLADRNSWLVDTYRAIRIDARAVARILDGFVNTKAEYLRLRSLLPSRLDLFHRAALLVYLNKTCFRGLFRVNAQGLFNVPYGAYRRRYYDLDELVAASEALAAAELRSGSFEHGLEGVARRDFVYLDPPYYKLGGWSDFNRYTEDQFREPDHERLAGVCRDLDRSGVRFLLSQSDTPFVRRLFEGFRTERIQARREINLDARRRDIAELVISNY